MTVEATAPVVAPAAVLWDMDGTLVDTEPYWMACEHELVDEFGGTWTEDDARSIIGFDLIDAAVVLRDRGGVDLDPHAIVERMLDGVIARVRERVPWRPGARRLLTELNDLGVPCALVTMSWRRLVDAITDELAPIRFQAVVTGDEVGRGKPDPEPYLLAADRLGVDAAECVAIEDSPTGVASAGAAGCVVVAVPNIVPIEPAPGRVVVPTLKDVTPRLLGTYLAELAAPADAVAAPAPARRPPTAGGDHRRQRARRRGRGRHRRRRTRRRRRQPTTAGGRGAARRAGVDAVLGHRGRPAGAARTRRARCTSCRRSGGGRRVSTPSPPRPTSRPTSPSSSCRPRATRACRSWRRSSTGPTPGVMAGILADPAQRATHVDAVATFAADNDFAGDRHRLRAVRLRRRSRHLGGDAAELGGVRGGAGRAPPRDGRTLTVSIPWISGDGTESDPGYWVYDYAAITPHVDNIRIMAYDYSVPSGEPGPIAPMPWVEQIIAATSAVSGDPSKLVLGIPLYGYNWVVATEGTCPANAEGNISLSTRDMADLAVRRGATPTFVEGDVEMRFSYALEVTDGTTTCTQQREVRYVNGDGAGLRMQRAVAAGFGGVSLFAFGYEDEATWNAINAISRQLAPAVSVPTTTPGG